ncbi:hypothetical protein, partial [Erwinia amylovora]|uniref:hypothetical protein n=1 Tax=Erwinia amylovora TaxID=552 RepID=UPI0020C143B9
PDTDLPELSLPEAEIQTMPEVPAELPELADAELPELAVPELLTPEIRGIEVTDLAMSTGEITAIAADDLTIPELHTPEPDISLPESTVESLDSITTLGLGERENHDPTLRHDLGEFEFSKTIDKEI